MSGQTFSHVVQIGIVVDDAEAAAHRYRDLCGIDGWNVNDVDTDRGVGSDFRLRGRPVPTRAKIVWARLGDVELELIEPQDSSSVYAEFLRDHGPGVHHVMLAADFDAAGDTFSEAGFALLAEGELQGGRFRLYDAQQALGMIIEIAEGETLTPDRPL